MDELLSANMSAKVAENLMDLTSKWTALVSQLQSTKASAYSDASSWKNNVSATKTLYTSVHSQLLSLAGLLDQLVRMTKWGESGIEVAKTRTGVATKTHERTVLGTLANMFFCNFGSDHGEWEA